MYGLYEYNKAGHMKVIKEESLEKGRREGREEGIRNTTELFSWLKANGHQEDIIRAVDDPKFLNELFDEFNGIDADEL